MREIREYVCIESPQSNLTQEQSKGSEMSFNFIQHLQRIAELEEHLRRLQEEILVVRAERLRLEQDRLAMTDEDSDSESDSDEDTIASDDTYGYDSVASDDECAVQCLCNCESRPKTVNLDED